MRSNIVLPRYTKHFHYNSNTVLLLIPIKLIMIPCTLLCFPPILAPHHSQNHTHVLVFFFLTCVCAKARKESQDSIIISKISQSLRKTIRLYGLHCYYCHYCTVLLILSCSNSATSYALSSLLSSNMYMHDTYSIRDLTATLLRKENQSEKKKKREK